MYTTPSRCGLSEGEGERDDVLAAVPPADERISHQTDYTSGCNPDIIQPNKKIKSAVILQPEQVNKKTAKLRRHRKWGRNQAMALNQDLSAN